jgi:hypothetical protein
MIQKRTELKNVLPLLCLVILASACGAGPPEILDNPTSPAVQTTDIQPSATFPVPQARPSSTPTTTPTSILDQPPATTAPGSPCAGLSGEIEVRVLVGPAEAVGLEPEAVGSVPFSVTSGESPFLANGSGSINYANTLEEQWGTYDVSIDMQLTVDGECISAGDRPQLQLTMGMTGSQMVEVTAEGFHGEYPWSGDQDFDLAFPLEEGASIEGEGYAFVLHLNNH